MNTIQESLYKAKQKFVKEVSEIEKRTDLTKQEKIDQITHIACAACAGVAIQPIPFADVFILTPIQAYFAIRLAAIHGIHVTESETGDLIKQVISLMGMGYIAQQVAIAIWKTVTFGLGGYLTIPLVYGLTYAIMKTCNYYFIEKSKGKNLSDEQLKDLFSKLMKEGKKRGEKYEDEKK